MNERLEGRLAARAYMPGDQLPAVGSSCLVSGANCDIDSDQHRGYSWRQIIGYTDDSAFVCLQTPGCWPTVERMTNCWFAEIPKPRKAGSGLMEGKDAALDVLRKLVECRYPARDDVLHAILLRDYDKAWRRARELVAALPQGQQTEQGSRK